MSAAPLAGGESRGQRFALLGAALLLFLLLMFAGGQPDRSTDERPSTVLLGDGGAKALFDVAQFLGLDPQPWMKPLVALDELVQDEELEDPEDETEAPVEPALPQVSGVMVLLEPEEPVEARDVAALLRFVDRGGHLVYAPSDDDALLEALALGGGADPLVPCKAEDGFEPVDELGAWGKRLLAEVDAPIHGFHRALTGLTSDTVTPLLVGPEGDLAAALVRRRAETSGSILLLSDAAALTNGALAKSELAPVVLRVCADLRGDGTLWFDEFHHGFDETGNVLTATWGWLTSSHVGHALIALAVAGLFAAAWAGLRFGAPIPRPAPERRSALEHVEALARAWQRNRAKKRPRELLIEGLRLRLGAAAELAPIAELTRDAAHGKDPIELARRVDALLAELRPARAAPKILGSGASREATRVGDH